MPAFNDYSGFLDGVGTVFGRRRIEDVALDRAIHVDLVAVRGLVAAGI